MGRVKDIGRRVHQDVYKVLVVDVSDEESLELIGDTEVVGEEKTDCKKGDYRHRALVTERSSLESYLLGGEGAEHRDKGLDVPYELASPARQVVVVEAVSL